MHGGENGAVRRDGASIRARVVLPAFVHADAVPHEIDVIGVEGVRQEAVPGGGEGRRRRVVEERSGDEALTASEPRARAVVALDEVRERGVLVVAREDDAHARGQDDAFEFFWTNIRARPVAAVAIVNVEVVVVDVVALDGRSALRIVGGSVSESRRRATWKRTEGKPTRSESHRLGDLACDCFGTPKLRRRALAPATP